MQQRVCKSCSVKESAPFTFIGADSLCITCGKAEVLREEGEDCFACGSGTFAYYREGSCSCHINPPCSSCVDAKLICDHCGEY